MLHLADGEENGNKALYYRSSINPANDVSTLFTLESFEGGYCLRNIDYDGLLLQTEMNAAWNFRTHDQPYPISWARFLFQNVGSSWTIENGTYAGNWLGLWTPENGYVDGEELACNKTGDEVGHFQLFAIPRERFHVDYINSQALPADASILIQNPAFDANSWALWTVKGTFGNQRFNGAAETWHSTNFTMQQTLKGLPAGQYVISCQMANGEGDNTGYLFAKTGEETQKAIVSQSCAGSDFDTQRNMMAADERYGLLTVCINVLEDEELVFGITEPTNGTTWLVFDNFRLSYLGPDVTEVEGLTGDMSGIKLNAVYDFYGRRIQSAILEKGVYIINGKKVLIK